MFYLKYNLFSSPFMSMLNDTKCNIEEYSDCQLCHNPLPHCHCRCPYCGERDKCECALFDAATGG